MEAGEGGGIGLNNSLRTEFGKLAVALQHTKHGFVCFSTPSADGQIEVISLLRKRHYTRQSIEYDCVSEKGFHGFSFINRLIKDNPMGEIFILYNFQHLSFNTNKSEFFQALNLSRDPWHSLKRLFLLGMTDDFEKQIMQNAPDFYSFFLTSFHFNIMLPKIYMELREPPFNVASISSESSKRVSKERFIRLLNEAAGLSDEAARLLGEAAGLSDEEETLLLDFLDAWLQCDAPISDRVSSHAEATRALNGLTQRSGQWDVSMPTANKYVTMARAYRHLKHYADAAKGLESAIKITAELQGASHRSAVSLYHEIADCYYLQGDYSKSMEWAKKTLFVNNQNNYCVEMSKDNDDVQLFSNSYFLQAVLEEKQGNTEAAIDCYKLSLIMKEIIGDRRGMAAIYHQLGMLWHRRRDYIAAESMYNSSLHVKNELRDDAGMAATRHQLGMLAQERGDYSAAKDLYIGSLQTSIKRADMHSVIATRYQLGTLAQERMDFDEAENWYKLALDSMHSQGDERGVACVNFQLGSVAKERGDRAAAKALYKQALAAFERLGDQRFARIAKHGLGNLDAIIT